MWLYKFEFVVEISLQERQMLPLMETFRQGGNLALFSRMGKRLLGFKICSDLIGSLQFRMSTLAIVL